jgi:carbon-monoxide dehydrogenase large subunit
MGHETALPQVLAAKLGLSIDSIRFLQADTAVTKTGGGHGGSRGLEVGGNAVAKAADEIVTKARTLVAHLLNSRPEDIEHAQGRFNDIKTGQSLSIGEVVAAAADASRLPPGMPAGALDTAVTYEREAVTSPTAAMPRRWRWTPKPAW